MNIATLANEFPVLVIIALIAFGASIGSFLNVVIYRLPIMMYKEWRSQCNELSADPVLEKLPEEDFSLAMPGSACPSCSTPIPPYHNLPIISYLLLRARCANCGAKISPRYFLVEVTGAMIALMIFLFYGLTAQAFFIMLFTFLLVPLIFIDIEYKLLPDNITYLLPTDPRTKRGQQFEVTVSHTLLAGSELENDIYSPQRQVAGDYTPQAGWQVYAISEQGVDNARPEQQIGNIIG